jgi:hypothetical protein
MTVGATLGTRVGLATTVGPRGAGGAPTVRRDMVDDRDTALQRERC